MPPEPPVTIATRRPLRLVVLSVIVASFVIDFVGCAVKCAR
jgi:hypothetical protein